MLSKSECAIPARLYGQVASREAITYETQPKAARTGVDINSPSNGWLESLTYSG
jgi:hypothetical protein